MRVDLVTFGGQPGRGGVVHVQQPVVIGIQRSGQVEPVREVVVLSAPAFIPLIHTADAMKRRGPGPDAAARRAPEQKSSQMVRICLGKAPQ